MALLDSGGQTWFVLPTAFADDGSIDLASQRTLVEAVASWGVDGILALAVMGEAAALTASERTAVLSCVADAAKGCVPVAIGCTAATTEVAVALVQQAAEAGAEAVMVSVPPLMRDLDAAPAFFGRVAGGGGLPLIVQDDPASTGVRIPSSILLDSLEASGSRVVKLEDPPTPPKIARLLAARADLRIFGGLGGICALSEMHHGAVGTMTGFAFPEVLRAVRERLEREDLAEAGAIFDRHLPLIALEAQLGVGLGVRKEALRARGALRSARTRIGPPLAQSIAEELYATFDRLGIQPSPQPLAAG